nr:hypothetical protein BaRGS_030218 [Batillaria attramentaria]
MEGGNFAKFSEKECRLVVVGKSGSGKSSVVNTILGADRCEVSFDPESTTSQAKSYSNRRFGKEVQVVDTPGLFDSRPTMTNEVVLERLATTALLLAPGPHAILLTLQLGQRFSEEEKAVVKQLRNFFGQDAMKHTIIVFTRGDELERQRRKITDYLGRAPADLKGLLSDVGHRYIVTNNVTTGKAREACAKSVLDLVEKMVRLNTNKFYSSDLFKSAEDEMKELDRSMDREFRPGRRTSSTSSLVSLTALSKDDLAKEITTIVKSEKSLATETNVKEDQKEAKDAAELAGLLGRLLRYVSRRRLGAGKNTTVIQNLRFSDEEKAVVHKLRVFFGEDSIRHTIVVFTKGDELVRNGVTIEEYLKSAPADLNSLINDVSYRYVVFNNKEPTIKGRDACAKSALDLVEKMARHNRTKHYSSDLFCHAEKQMVACDRETERPFRPKQQGGSSNSLDSLSTVPDDHLIVEISSILESEPSLVEETKVKEERTTAAKDHSALRELMGRLVRHANGDVKNNNN